MECDRIVTLRMINLRVQTHLHKLQIPGWGVMLTTQLHLLPRLRMDPVIPLLHLYAFVHEWGDLYLLLHGVTFRKNTMLMLTGPENHKYRKWFWRHGWQVFKPNSACLDTCSTVYRCKSVLFCGGFGWSHLFIVLGCYRNKHEFLAGENCRAYLRVSRKELKKRSGEPERDGWNRQHEGKCV